MHADTDVERIRLSRDLSSLSAAFTAESYEWSAETAKANCSYVADVLADLSRTVLTTEDPDRARQWWAASELLLRQVHSTRRFLRALTIPPTVRRASPVTPMKWDADQ